MPFAQPEHSNPRCEEIRRAVQTAFANLLSLLSTSLAALEPGRLYLAPGPASWSVMENLAHIREFMPYWANEVAKLVASPGQPFGRTQQDEGRLRAIREHGHDNLAAIQSALPASYAVLERVLSTLTDADLELTGVHVKFGERTLGWFIDEFIVRHLQDHIEQIRECL